MATPLSSFTGNTIYIDTIVKCRWKWSTHDRMVWATHSRLDVCHA